VKGAIAAIMLGACARTVAPLPVASPSPCDERHQHMGAKERQEAVFYDQVFDALSARWNPDRVAGPRPRRAAVVELTVDVRGAILAARIARSSGNAAFDVEALAAAARAARVPPPPGELIEAPANAAIIRLGFGLEAGETTPSDACLEERTRGQVDPMRWDASPPLAR
jgi:TonB family protein